jgi:hypothetical protein
MSKAQTLVKMMTYEIYEEALSEYDLARGSRRVH